MVYWIIGLRWIFFRGWGYGVLLFRSFRMDMGNMLRLYLYSLCWKDCCNGSIFFLI